MTEIKYPSKFKKRKDYETWVRDVPEGNYYATELYALGFNRAIDEMKKLNKRVRK